ncbi:MAG: filamentous hemagglutinin N-terminal domain-containing protein [Parachlamydiales bacterium]|nr:filamentous hemagglutinin N-terminal domain-containing protein [Parachlamydiales bacterium]
MRYFLFCQLLLGAALEALPGSLEVSSGSAELNLSSPEVLEILASDKSILNWQEFSIQENEKVIFALPDVSSCVLNRVLGENPSQIFGAIESNGKILLINPNGILFGERSRIDVGSFAASTLNINNEMFLANQKWRSEDGVGSGSISILGSISAKGELSIKAPEINCEGSIRVPGGRVEVLGNRLALLNKGSIDVSGPEKGGTVLFGGDFQGKNPDVPNASTVFFGPETSVRADAITNGDGGKLIFWSDNQTYFFGTASAQGGPQGGNGGFVEVSGLGALVYDGKVNTLAASGMAGTLLLDPIGFTISSGVTVSMTALPNSSPTAAGANLNNAALQTALGSNNVILMTNSATAAQGNINWQSTGGITWNTARNLTLLAHNDITLNASVTNTGAAPGGSMYFVAGWDGVTMGAPFGAGTFGNANGFTGNILIDVPAGNVTISSTNGTINFLGQNITVQNTSAISSNVLISAPSSAGTTAITMQATQNISILGGTSSIAASLDVQSTNGGIALTAGGNIGIQSGNTFNNNGAQVLCRGPINFTATGNISADPGASAGSTTLIQTSGPNGPGDINFTSTNGNILIAQAAPSALINQEKVRIRNTGGGSISFVATNGSIFANTTSTGLQITEIGLLATTTNINFTANNLIQVTTRGPSGGQNVKASNSITFLTTNPAGTILIGNGTGVGPSTTTIQTTNGPITMTSNTITLMGGTGSVENVLVTSNLGAVLLSATPSGNLSFIGGSMTGNSGVLVSSTQSTVTLLAPGGNVLFQGGSTAGASAVAQADVGGVTVTTPGNVSLLGGTSNVCSTRILSAAGPIAVTAGGNLTLQSSPVPTNGTISEILSTSGNITLAIGGNITLTGISGYARVQTTSGIIQASGNNLTMTSGSTGSGFGFPPFTSFSSRNGSIGITLLGNLSMTGGIDPLAYTAIGWRTAGVEAATAPITLNISGTASLFGGPNALAATNYAQIGHIGGGTMGGAGVPQTGSASAAINVIISNTAFNPTALQLIGSDNAGTNLSYAQIGHGGAFWNSGAAMGNIQVTVNQGNIFMRGGRTNDYAAIGHVALSTVSTSSVTGAITVNVQNGNLNVVPPLNTGSTTSPAGIFLYAPSVLAGSSINVFVNGNISLGGGRSSSMALIGASGNAAGGVSLDPPVLVCVTNNLLLGAPGGASGVGLVAPGVPLNLAVGDVTVSVGGNATLSPTMVGTNNGEHIAFIGTPNAQALGAGPFTSNTFLAVQGNLSVLGDVNGTDLVNNNAEVYGLNDANIGVVGSVTVRGGFRNARIGSRLQAPLSTVRLWAGGDIIFQNSNLGGLGQLGSTGLAGQGGNIDVRSAGDIRLSSSIIQTAAAASIFVQGGSSFAAGDLITPLGASITAVDLQPATGFLCATAASPAIGPDPGNNLGTVRIDTAGYNSAGTLVTPAAAPGITLQTINGNLTINSADRFQTSDANYGIASGAFSNLTLAGPGVNAMVLLSTSGNITVAGPSPTDSFHDITVNTVPSPWTSGNIFMSANNNMTINSTISTNGAGSSITLIADQNDTNVDGPGILTINANVTTSAGPILLDSGFGSGPGGISSINQIAGTVNSNGGTITAHAVGDITISGAATSFSSGAGNQIIQSTNGNIQIDEDILSTSGSVTVLADAESVTLSTATGSGGSIQTSSGPISVTAAKNITINGDPTTLFSLTGSISTLAGDDTNVTTNVSTGDSVLMITGNNMSLFGTANITSSGSFVTLVVDNDFPAAPLMGTGFFSMAAGARVNAAGTLQIFTAQQPYNTILGLLNGVSFARGTLFQDTNTEVWCTYYPSGIGGSPFTVFYKNCLQQVMQQATIVVQQFLVTLEPFVNPNWPYYGVDEYYGWPTKFYIVYHQLEDFKEYPSEPYFLRTGNRLISGPRSVYLLPESRRPLR